MQRGKNIQTQDGFTLVELAVVLLILGVLVAIAIPVFLGTRSRANDVTAQRMTVRAVKAARIIGTDVGNFSKVTTKTLSQTEPEISWLGKNAKSTGGSDVSEDVPDVKTIAHTFVAAAYSSSGTCFFIRYSITAGTEYGTIAKTTTSKCYAANTKKVTFGATSW